MEGFDGRVVRALPLVVALGLAGCNGGIGGLQGGSGVAAAIAVRPGQIAVFTGFLNNVSGRTITLRSATVDALHGFATPRLVRVAVASKSGAVSAARGWPPAIAITRMDGYRVANGDQVNVVFGLVAQRPGTFAARGIVVTVTAGGDSANVPLTSAAGVCVRLHDPTSCPAVFQNRLSRAVRL
jgi:hypothetical protein